VQVEALRRLSSSERFDKGLRFLRMTREWLALECGGAIPIGLRIRFRKKRGG